jgi:hypothetical protein
MNKPFVVLLVEFTGFDCLTNDGFGLSSDFICRGGTGGAAEGKFVEFLFDSDSENIKVKFYIRRFFAKLCLIGGLIR